jgi:hypothetical protein
VSRRAKVELAALVVMTGVLITWGVAVLEVDTFRRVVAVAYPVGLIVAAWIGWRSGR